MKFFSTERLVLFAIILGLLIWLFSLKKCSDNKFSSQKAELDSITLANQAKTVSINKLNQKVTTQAVIISDNQGSIKALAEENFNLKKDQQNRIKQYNILLQTKTNTRIDTLEIAYVDKDAIKRFSDSIEKRCATVINYYRDSFIKVPKDISIDTSKNKYFQFSGTVKKDGFRLNSVNFPDTQNIAIYETKGGLLRRDATGKLKVFSKSKLEIKVLHTNTYIDLKGISSIVYNQKKGAWTTIIAAIAAILGIYLGTKL